MLQNLLINLIVIINVLPSAVAPPQNVDGIPVEPEISEQQSIYQQQWEDRQVFVASEYIKDADLERGSYSATTPEEIAAKKEAERKAEEERIAAEKAAEEARLKAENEAKRKTLPQGQWASASYANLSCASGYCWPVSNFNYTYENNGFQTSQRPNHNGFDMLTAAGTPIYAVADGVVRVSTESWGGYGVVVTIDHTIDGQVVNTTYAHMTYGSRKVEAGDRVTAGQVIGLVGSTGNSTANHLHFEVRINGSLVEPFGWLQKYAGAQP